MSRDCSHDYRSRCIYHITMTKAPVVPPFSRIAGSLEQPVVERSALGRIVEQQIRELPLLCPALRILQYVVMPDHLHLALFAESELPKALGSYLGMMKVKCGQLAEERLSIRPPLFERDFYDRILRRGHNLDTICEYIRQNPYRLLVRHLHPEYFRRVNSIEINGEQWQAYGNMQLLDNPFKAPVVIHRADSEPTKWAKRCRWKHLAENGGVLVSPFISPEEKEVRRECEEVGGKVILLSCKPFGKREKPAARDFELCAEGKLLILAPLRSVEEGRAAFLYLNSVAELIGLREKVAGGFGKMGNFG